MNARLAQNQRKKNQDGKAKVRRAMLALAPKGGTVIEIGVWRGEFTRMLLNQLRPAKLILVDPWQNFGDRAAAFDGATKDKEFEEIYQSIRTKYAAEIEAGIVEIIRAPSSVALAEMPAETLDFAYLDGDHSYEGVKADLGALLPLMKIGGIIMLDDYHRRGWWGDGVIRAANEFLGLHPQQLRIWSMRGAQLAIERLA